MRLSSIAFQVISKGPPNGPEPPCTSIPPSMAAKWICTDAGSVAWTPPGSGTRSATVGAATIAGHSTDTSTKLNKRRREGRPECQGRPASPKQILLDRTQQRGGPGAVVGGDVALKPVNDDDGLARVLRARE